MEKFYLVGKESALYKQYQAREEYVKKSLEVFNDINKELGIESSKLLLNVEQIGIIPTNKDISRFSAQLIAKTYEDGVRLFKKASAVNKVWSDACKKAGLLKSISPPTPMFFGISGTGTYRYFENTRNGNLYMSIDFNKEIETPEFFTEIKGSEFYKIMETFEENG